jgi:hypothetical protein
VAGAGDIGEGWASRPVSAAAATVQGARRIEAASRSLGRGRVVSPAWGGGPASSESGQETTPGPFLPEQGPTGLVGRPRGSGVCLVLAGRVLDRLPSL